MSMSDRVVILRDGRIEQQGSPVDIYRKPHSPFVAHFLGMTNVMAGDVCGIDAHTVAIRAGGLEVRGKRPEFTVSPGSRVSCVVRPDVITLLPVSESKSGDLSGVVRDVRFLGSVVHYTVAAGGHNWQVSARSSDVANFSE